MPVIILETKDFTSPLFLVRTWAVLSSCTTFSLVSSLEPLELNKNSSRCQHLNPFRIYCMFTWCFFFTLTLLIHILSVIQFHNLIPVSWKNLTVTVALLGALMSLSASVLFPWVVMDHQKLSPRSVAAAVVSCLTFLAYSSESYILRNQAQEQRGYMGSMPGLLKIFQLWGGCQMIVLVVEVVCVLPPSVHHWQVWVTSIIYAICVLTCFVTVVVILGDCAGRCLLPFDKCMTGFNLTGVLFYMVATVICFTEILHLREKESISSYSVQLVIMETVVTSVTLLVYTVDFAFSIKLLCDRGHS
ncbi:myeloid-associated differentiation marker-like [Hippoglossus hippoglossus]|uniref:myeloid-associated differentiation marker-like n=1 Tax=Hippoglossus hippoglossus TaxID=8267 RepID=UPI00148CDCBA|nr:myeloid-associated differentiation marker-like [Hippoglossus hippoglossus]